MDEEGSTLIKTGTFEQIKAYLENHHDYGHYFLTVILRLIDAGRVDVAMQVHDNPHLSLYGRVSNISKAHIILLPALTNNVAALRFLLDRGLVYVRNATNPKSLLHAVLLQQKAEMRSHFGDHIEEFNVRGVEERVATLQLLIERGELEKEAVPELLLGVSLSSRCLPLTLALLDAGLDPHKKIARGTGLCFSRSFKRDVQMWLAERRRIESLDLQDPDIHGWDDNIVTTKDTIKILNHITAGPTLFSVMIKRINF